MISSPKPPHAWVKVMLALALIGGAGSLQTASAALISFNFTNSVSQPDTNFFFVVQVETNNPTANSDGTSFTTIGPPIRIYPSPDGRATNQLAEGNWKAYGPHLGNALLFRSPLDHGPTVYNMWGLRISGYNTYVTIQYGTNLPPTFDEVTNVLGGKPLPAEQVTNFVKGVVPQTYWTSTVSIWQSNIINFTTNVLGSAAFRSVSSFQPPNVILTNAASGIINTNPIVAGANITLSTNAGAITINSSGGGGGGSNSVSAGNTLIIIATNSGNFAVSAVNQTNRYNQNRFTTNADNVNINGINVTNTSASLVTSEVTNRWKMDGTNTFFSLALVDDEDTIVTNADNVSFRVNTNKFVGTNQFRVFSNLVFSITSSNTSVSPGNSLVTVATNIGNFAVSGISQTNGQTTLIYTNPSMVLMTNIWIPSSNSLASRIDSQIQVATNAIATYLTNHLAYTNDTRVLFMTNVNNRVDSSASHLKNAILVAASGWTADGNFTNFWAAGNVANDLVWSFTDGIISPSTTLTFTSNGIVGKNGSLYLESNQTNRFVATNSISILSFTNQQNIVVAQIVGVNAMPTFGFTTNQYALYGSGEVTNNVTFFWDSTYNVYSNPVTHVVIRTNAPVMQVVRPDGSIHATAPSLLGPWTLSTGTSPAPTNSSYGADFDIRGLRVIGDLITASTNLHDAFAISAGGLGRTTVATMTNAANTFDGTLSNTASGNVAKMTQNGAFVISGQPIISTNTFQFLEQYPVQTNASLAVNAGLEIHGDYTYYSTGNYWYHPTNSDPTAAIAAIYQTNFTAGQVVWVMAGGGFPAYWKTNANLYGPEPWYPDPSFWSDLLSMNITNVVRVSALSPIEAMMATESKMAQRFHESTRVPAFNGGLPIAELENYPASGSVLTNAVTFLTNSLLQGIIDVVEMDRWAYKRNSNGDQIFDTATFGSLTLSGYSTYLHANGFKAALHMDYGSFDITLGAGTTFAASTASYPYYHQDATNLVSNGIDMMLMDTTALPPVGPSTAQDYAVQFIHEIRAAQATYNRPFFVEGAFNGSFPGHFEDWMPIADGWTTAEDIGTDAEFLKALKTTTGYRGFGKYPFLANPDDTAFTASAIAARRLGAFVAIGPTHIQFHTTNNLTQYTVGVWTNSEWRAIWRDSAGNPGYQISSNATGEVWARQMANGDTVVAMMNLIAGSGTLTVNWNDLKIAPSNTVMLCRDIYRFTNVVVATQLSVSLDAHEGSMWRLMPASQPGKLSGNGSPEGSVSAPVGWIYQRLDSTGTTYIKTNGVNGTGWYDTLLNTHG